MRTSCGSCNYYVGARVLGFVLGYSRIYAEEGGAKTKHYNAHDLRDQLKMYARIDIPPPLRAFCRPLGILCH